ncbi:hypothetical protein DH86_00001494 [Scytalidium sp. 3C]|nr:hypothetical protein DH86_00001494 [Scytalidium sp. 3C]
MTIIALCLIKLSLLVFWSLPQNAIVRTRMTIAAAVFDLAAAVAIGLLSPLEHAKSLRPSILLSVFLFFTTILDVARTRTEWLLSGSSVIPSLFVTSLAVKCLLVVLEGLSKASHSQAIDRPEQTSGIYSLSFFAWLNPLIYRGNRGNLRLYDLNPVDQHISSTWVNERVKSRYSLALAIARALWAPITATMMPRLALIAFSIVQPFLVETTIEFVENQTKPDRYGYWLVAAFGLTYLGIAVSTAWYEYLTARALSMIRAALISIIYTSSLDIAVGTVEVSSPASLMGADVERIVTRLRWVLSTAPNIIQVAVAFYILSLRLGPICLAPLPVVLAAAYASSQVAKKTIPRQRQWMQAVQKRVVVTSEVLASIKGMKMLGLTKIITDMVHGMRKQELVKSKRFRYVQVINITLGTFQLMAFVYVRLKIFVCRRKCVEYVVSSCNVDLLWHYCEILLLYRTNSGNHLLGIIRDVGLGNTGK